MVNLDWPEEDENSNNPYPIKPKVDSSKALSMIQAKPDSNSWNHDQFSGLSNVLKQLGAESLFDAMKKSKLTAQGEV